MVEADVLAAPLPEELPSELTTSAITTTATITAPTISAVTRAGERRPSGPALYVLRAEVSGGASVRRAWEDAVADPRAAAPGSAPESRDAVLTAALAAGVMAAAATRRWGTAGAGGGGGTGARGTAFAAPAAVAGAGEPGAGATVDEAAALGAAPAVGTLVVAAPAAV